MRAPLLPALLALPLLAGPGPVPPAEAAVRILAEARRSNGAYAKLQQLCDQVGPRFSGTPGYLEAVKLVQAQFEADGLTNIHTERVMVPRWIRGAARIDLVGAPAQHLNVIAVGMSASTPAGGVEAEVLVVSSFEELKARAAEARGRIVCFDVPFEGYGKTVAYRGRGAVEAAKVGAVACLLRSVSPVSLDTPHTGALGYQEGVPRIPCGALSLESATLLHRLSGVGKYPKVRLVLETREEADVENPNVVAELPGRELPGEVVLLGAHLDSWDVGQGAQDDGAGCVQVMEAVALLKRLGLTPRRTLRVVLFANEENGLRGGRAYAEAHRGEADRIVAAMESDSGSGLIQGFTLDLGGAPRREARPAPDARGEAALARLRALAPLMAATGATRMELGGSGADIGPLVPLGVPGLGISHDASRYWDIHHTQADTLDKVVPADLATNAASIAILAYALAEAPERLLPAK